MILGNNNIIGDLMGQFSGSSQHGASSSNDGNNQGSIIEDKSQFVHIIRIQQIS
jgi:hypothetical protein